MTQWFQHEKHKRKTTRNPDRCAREMDREGRWRGSQWKPVGRWVEAVDPRGSGGTGGSGGCWWMTSSRSDSRICISVENEKTTIQDHGRKKEEEKRKKCSPAARSHTGVGEGEKNPSFLKREIFLFKALSICLKIFKHFIAA